MSKTTLARYAVLPILFVALAVAAVTSCSIGQEYLSGIKWPKPPIVTPGKADADPPSDAVILFDGQDLSAWEGGENWKIEDGIAIVQGGDITSKQSFGDCQVHIEWSAPMPATGEGQGRGNSGVFLMDRYEVQVLDSYENHTYFDGQASAIYKQTPPMVNAMRKPGEWNTYDIIWTAPKFKADGKLESPAYITVLHNGVLTLNHFELKGITPFNEAPTYTQHGKAPIHLQDHGNPVRYRNIWARELKPILGKKEREPYFRDDSGKEWPASEKTSAVEGRININGEPLQNATITLHPSGDGKKVEGDVEEGRYRLKKVPAGQYIVSLEAKDKARDSRIARKYRKRDESGLRVDITSGENVIDLDLSSR
jgi:hypothetical protein